MLPYTCLLLGFLLLIGSIIYLLCGIKQAEALLPSNATPGRA